MTVNLKSLVVPLGGYCNHCFDTGYKRKHHTRATISATLQTPQWGPSVHDQRARWATGKHSRNGEFERSGDFPDRRFSFTPFAFNNFLLKPTVNFANSPSTGASRIVLMRRQGLYTLRHSEGNCTSSQMNIMSSQQKNL